MKPSPANRYLSPLLICRNLSKTFCVRGQQIPVFSNINLSVQPGEMVVIFGRSGAGKSTLLQIMAGLDWPTTGSVTLNNHALAQLSNNALSQLRQNKIGMIFQRFNLLPSWTALENVQAALHRSSLTRIERLHQARTLLTELGLGQHCHHLPIELSVGQQQRVAVARALVHSPAIVFADEPCGDVDPVTGTEIIDCLIRCVRKQKCTLIVATHGPFPLQVADHVLHLAHGALTESREEWDKNR